MQVTSIATFLERVRGLLYRHEAARAAMYALAGLAGLALVLPLVGHLVGTRASALAVVGIGGLAAVIVVGWAIVIGVVVPRKRLAGDNDVARWVGGIRKDLASDLLSSVELANAPVRPGAPSKQLVAALIENTEDALVEVDPVALVPRRDFTRARRWAIAIVLVNGVLVLAAPRVIADGWRRLVAAPPAPFDGAQLSAVPLVGDLDVTLRFPAYSKKKDLDLPSSSGDVRGLPGTVVLVKGHTLTPASAVEIVFDTPESAPLPPIPCKLEGGVLSAELVIGKSARYRFAVTSPSGTRSIEATARAIEAETDQAPSVQLVSPAEPMDVTNVKRVELAYVIEDDFGLGAAELVWEGGPSTTGPGTVKDKGRKAIKLDGGSRATGKLVWDLSEVVVPSGGEVRYWVEAKDNDAVGGPNVGKSRELHLHVVSPRERHEETLAREQELAEKIIHQLGLRLTITSDDEGTRDDLNRQLREAVVELGSIAGAFEKDPHASDAMRKVLASMRDRLDHLATSELKIVPKGKPAAKGAYVNIDRSMVSELEDDSILLADWLDRERLEGLLDISDEISAHQKRLKDLLADYARTKDPHTLDDIEREMRALDKAYAELSRHEKGMPEDVLDQYVNQTALQPHASCIDEVRALVRAGKTAEAQTKLEQCRAQHERSSEALEGSLATMRGDRFTDEQKKLDEVMNELADVAKDQDDIAAEANRIFEAYAEKADEVARGNRREASKKIGALVDKLRRRLSDINESGLTPFAKDELDVVQRRLADVEHMVADGDLAEALGMAHQAKQSLDTIAGELEAAMTDDPKSKWAEATQEALDGVEKSTPVAKELIDELKGLSPRPEQIMSSDDQHAIERLRRREAMNRERAKKLGDRTKQLGGELPGDAATELGKKLGGAVEQMGLADDRMQGHDPSGTREATRSAAEQLSKARDRARRAARQAQEGNVGDEPIRIPGADEYKAPERFREDILEAAKKKGPDEYKEMIEEYYKELVR